MAIGIARRARVASRLARPAVRRATMAFGLAAATWGVAGPLEAQVSFTWPAAQPNIERYTNLEECVWAIDRVRDSVEHTSPIADDTMPPAAATAQALQPLPPPVHHAASQCGARFLATADTAPRGDMYSLMHLALMTHQDSLATRIAARWLGFVPAKALLERGAVLDSILMRYLGRRLGGMDEIAGAAPARVEAAERLLPELLKLDPASVPWQYRLPGPDQMLRVALIRDDTALARRSAERVRSVVATLTAADRRERKPSDPDPVSSDFLALRVLGERAAIDSLRRGPDAFIALQRANWTKASGERGEDIRIPIGEVAPPLEGAFWFNRPDTTEERPTKGKVAMVVFLSHLDCALHGCRSSYALLHRLHRQFPELQITIASRTFGYMRADYRGAMDPPPPEVEADLLKKTWIDEQKLPAALVVAQTDFWRLPEPDRRRMNRDVPNEKNYAFGRRWPVGHGGLYVVDRNGRIVSTDADERRLTAILEMLFAQQAASR